MNAANGRALVYCAGGGIGDSLMASVVAQALHRRFARVDALTLPAHEAALDRVPDVSEVIVDDNAADERQLAARLAERKYDACVITWATLRSARVAQRAKIPTRVGQARRMYSYRFTKRVVVRSETGDVASHWSDILLDYARALGCDAPGAVPHFVPTETDEREAAGILNGIAEKPFLILHPTNAVATRRGFWPTGGWSALARALLERFEMPVLVSGTDADRPIVEAIVRDSGATSLAGATGIGSFGALARRARCFVGITTGSMHVAAAVGCPTVGIFPFQSDYPERWGPLGDRTAIVRASYPCHAGDTKETCPDYACVANLDVPRIIAAAELLTG
jgi:ADP-heptose:LPS heptosyltransferase